MATKCVQNKLIQCDGFYFIDCKGLLLTLPEASWNQTNKLIGSQRVTTFSKLNYNFFHSVNLQDLVSLSHDIYGTCK